MTITLRQALISSTCLSIAFSCIAASAQPATGDNHEIIITANRLPQIQGETLAATSVITREHIDARQAVSLFELLGTSAGIQTARAGGDGSQTSLFMRGTNSDHTLVLIDGVRINTASEGFARLEHIPVDQIERIEVVRGPHSSVHGADAIGGVIHVFTRQATDDRPGLSGDLRGGFGTENTYTGNAAILAGSDRTRLGLNLSHYRTDGIRPRNAPTPSEQRSNYDNDAATMNVSHALQNGGTVQAHYTVADSELLYDGGFSEAQHVTTGALASLPLNERWTSTIQINRFRDSNRTYSFADSHNRTRRDAIKWQNHMDISDRADLLIGVDYEDEDLFYDNPGAEQTETGRHNVAAFGVYHRRFDRLETTLSARSDRNQQFGSKTTGRFAIGTGLSENIDIWAAWSTAFKAPKLLDLYVDFPAFFFFANPDLQPETARNLELGANADLWKVKWSVNLFQNDIRDLITTNENFDSLTNVGRARIRGAEVSADTELAGWTLNAALTLLDHENRDTGQALLRRPDEMFSLGLNRRFEQLTVNLHWQVRGAQDDVDPVTFGRSRVAGNGVVDMALGWEFNNRLSMHLKAGNLLYKTYQVVDGYNTHGRTAMLSTRYRF